MSELVYKKLENQPLKFVLAEFQFSPVLQMADYIPKLHDRLRQEYPIPSKRTEQAVQVQQTGINLSAVDSWSFLSANKKNAVDINQNRMVFCTSDYPRFQGFSELCRNALVALAEVVNPALILRIGLRYGDLLTLSEGESMTDLVDTHFTPSDAVRSLGGDKRQQRGEIFLKTEHGELAIRTLYGFHNLSIMPDTQGIPIEIDLDNDSSERMLLDLDHFWTSQQSPEQFDVEQILERLSSLHQVSRDAFWKVTTEYARNEKWS